MSLQQAPTAKPKLLVLLGPTAVGKTKLSLEIATRFRCEIISGDSMQVYRGMDIGTAKVTPVEQQLIPHHLIDIRNPDEPFSVADFHQLAAEKISEIHARGHLPFVVGGTGLYIEALCYEYQFSEVGADEAFRSREQQFAERFGVEALHKKLAEVDPKSAARLHPNDLRRVIRALEIYHATGKTIGEQLRSHPKSSPYDLCLLGLTMDRAILYKRIEERIDGMISEGLIQEVRRLLENGFTSNVVAMQGLGYKEIAAYLTAQISLDEAIQLLKRNTRRFAKRQLSWFRRMQGIHWVDVSDLTKFSAHSQAISDIITGKF